MNARNRGAGGETHDDRDHGARLALRTARITIVTPAPPSMHNGNRATAERWARRFEELGHRVEVTQSWDGLPCDVLVALHATRSVESVERFHRESRGTPLVVAMTGTDLYVDLPASRDARRSIELADRLVTLQPLAIEALPENVRHKARVIYQSAEPYDGPCAATPDAFCVCLLAHLRDVKDPLRAASATRMLPESSRLRVVHAGAALDEGLAEQATVETRTNERYTWLGDMPPSGARRLLAESQLLAVTSRSEGGANVLTEAIASGVPVISSRIAGSIGLLGLEYPGYYPVGDTAALAALLLRTERDTAFLDELKARCDELRPLTRSERERQSWESLLSELL